MDIRQACPDCGMELPEPAYTWHRRERHPELPNPTRLWPADRKAIKETRRKEQLI